MQDLVGVHEQKMLPFFFLASNLSSSLSVQRCVEMETTERRNGRLSVFQAILQPYVCRPELRRSVVGSLGHSTSLLEEW